MAASLLIAACFSSVTTALATSSPPPTDARTTDSTVVDSVEETTPETTAPDPTPPDTAAPSPAVVGGTSDNDTSATTLTWIAIVASLLLVGLAGWWMLRRDDRVPMPPMDDDWPSESDVI